MFLYEITFWSRTANSEKHTANENSGLTTIGVTNNLCEVDAQGFDGIDAKNINCVNKVCNITRILDCNSEKKRKKPWLLILLVKDALTSYLIGQGRFDVLSYLSRRLWRLILLIKDALTSDLIDHGRFDVLHYCSKRFDVYIIVLGRFGVLSCWSRTLSRLILLLKDAMKSDLIGQGHFEVLSYCSRTLWSLILLIKVALTSYLIGKGRFEVLSYW